MKLKGLGKRAYNILFHTHTVAGITISAALFVIFYAGSFALFRMELRQWEDPASRKIEVKKIDTNDAIDLIAENYPDFDLSKRFTLRQPTEAIPYMQFSGMATKRDSTTERFWGTIAAGEPLQLIKEEDAHTTLSETIYRLHYLGQIPFGLYLSGLASLFFLFATITGVAIHWQHLVTKFYAFRTTVKWKQIWTNAHTILGLLGLPFQIVYAVTGAFFGLLTLLLIPSAFILFGGDTDKVVATVRPETTLEIDPDSPLVGKADLNKFASLVEEKYPGYHIPNMVVMNYGHEDALATFYLDDERTLNGVGQIIYRLHTGKVEMEVIPNEKSYTSSVLDVLGKLHFGNYGGILLRIVYFILAMITCLMLLSGILLWQTARDKKSYTDKQKQFHHKVTKINLAVCLSLFPAVALLFAANKLIPSGITNRPFYENTAFFVGWLLMVLAGLRWNNFKQLNKNYLLIGGVLALFIPIANGLVTGDWLFKTLTSNVFVASVDLFWLFAGLTALFIVYTQKNRQPELLSEPVVKKSQPAPKKQMLTNEVAKSN